MLYICMFCDFTRYLVATCSFTEQFCYSGCLFLHPFLLKAIDRHLRAESVVQNADERQAEMQTCVLPVSTPQLYDCEAQKDNRHGDRAC